LLVGGSVQTMSGSNQMDSDPRLFKLSMQTEQFVVLCFVGAQRLMTSSYHADFTRRIPSDDLGNKARKALSSCYEPTGLSKTFSIRLDINGIRSATKCLVKAKPIGTMLP
jgi:hypothetical protein